MGRILIFKFWLKDETHNRQKWSALIACFGQKEPETTNNLTFVMLSGGGGRRMHLVFWLGSVDLIWPVGHITNETAVWLMTIGRLPHWLHSVIITLLRLQVIKQAADSIFRKHSDIFIKLLYFHVGDNLSPGLPIISVPPRNVQSKRLALKQKVRVCRRVWLRMNGRVAQERKRSYGEKWNARSTIVCTFIAWLKTSRVFDDQNANDMSCS